MELTEFKNAVIARKPSGELLIALMDGAETGPTPHRCVGLLLCRPDAARSMCADVGSALNDEDGQ